LVPPEPPSSVPPKVAPTAKVNVLVPDPPMMFWILSNTGALSEKVELSDETIVLFGLVVSATVTVPSALMVTLRLSETAERSRVFGGNARVFSVPVTAPKGIAVPLGVFDSVIHPVSLPLPSTISVT